MTDYKKKYLKYKKKYLEIKKQYGGSMNSKSHPKGTPARLKDTNIRERERLAACPQGVIKNRAYYHNMFLFLVGVSAMLKGVNTEAISGLDALRERLQLNPDIEYRGDMFDDLLEFLKAESQAENAKNMDALVELGKRNNARRGAASTFTPAAQLRTKQSFSKGPSGRKN